MSDHHSPGHGSDYSVHGSQTTGATATPSSSLYVENSVNYFGLTNFRNQYRKFGIKSDDRLRHVYVIGKSGMGKSTLLETMIINDIYAGQGVGIIDPHGDLAENILRYMPQERIKDVIYFNPGDLDFPVGFNILETVPSEVHGRISDGIRGLFKKIWPDVWSPRMENILNNVILALLEFPGASLMSINRMLADEEYFDQVVAKVQNPAVKLFWTKEYSTWNDKYKQEAIAPIQNKVGQFLSGSLIRNLVAQTKSTFNIRSIMDSGKIFIVNLAKGTIGEENSKLLGGMLVTTIYTSAMGRADIKNAKDRRPFFLYVDEFQNFATESFADILSEARKYGLSLTMAHQYMKQLDEKVLDAVIGNVGTMMSFRIGSGDSEILAKEFAPTFVEEDFLNLPKYQIYLKLLIDGVASAPFSAQTIPPAFNATPYKEQAIQFSREHYTVPRQTIEAQVLDWSGMTNIAPEKVARLGEIDDDEDGVPDFLQFKNKQSKKELPAHQTRPASVQRSAGGVRSHTSDRGGNRGGDDRRRTDIHRPQGSAGARRDGSMSQRPPSNPPRTTPEQRPVLIVDPAQPGISLTKIAPKKELNDRVSEKRQTDDPRRSDRPHRDDRRGGRSQVPVAPQQNSLQAVNVVQPATTASSAPESNFFPQAVGQQYRERHVSENITPMSNQSVVASPSQPLTSPSTSVHVAPADSTPHSAIPHVPLDQH